MKYLALLAMAARVGDWGLGHEESPISFAFLSLKWYGGLLAYCVYAPENSQDNWVGKS